MIYKSIHKYARISPSKARRVARLMSGRKYDEAMTYLQYLPHAAAAIIRKVAKSAASNALSKDGKLDEASLFVRSVLVDEGPRMKRVWRRGRGRMDLLLKRFSHVAVEVTDDEKELHKSSKKENGQRRKRS